MALYNLQIYVLTYFSIRKISPNKNLAIENIKHAYINILYSHYVQKERKKVGTVNHLKTYKITLQSILHKISNE